MNPDEFEDLPQIEVKIEPGSNMRWLGDLMDATHKNMLVGRIAHGAMMGKTSFVDFAVHGQIREEAQRFNSMTLDTITVLFENARTNPFTPIFDDFEGRGLLRKSRTRSAWSITRLNTMSERELTQLRVDFKSFSFAYRVGGDDLGQQHADALDDLTRYMQRRFPRHGSTPPCEAVCV